MSTTEQSEIILKSQLIKESYPQIVVNENDFTMDSDVITMNDKYDLLIGQVERILEEDRMKAVKEYGQMHRNIDKLKKIFDIIQEGNPDVDGTMDLINRIPDEEDLKIAKDAVEELMIDTSNQEHYKDLMNRTLRDILKSARARMSLIERMKEEIKTIS